MIRVFAFILASCSIFLPAVQADIWDPTEFHTAISTLNTSHEIAGLVRHELGNADATQIWHEALELSSSVQSETPSGRAHLVRLIETAAQVGGATIAEGPLDLLASADLQALQSAIGLPAEADLLQYFFSRPVSLRGDFAFERYTIVRSIEPAFGVHVIRERTSAPYLDLGPSFSLSLLEPEDDGCSARLRLTHRVRCNRTRLAR